MPDLDTMLQDFASFIEEELPSPDVETVLSVAATPPAMPRRLLRPVLVAAASAMLVLAVVGLPVLFLSGDESTVSEPSTTTVAPTTATSVTTTAAPDQVIGTPQEAAADVFSWTEDDISNWVTEDEITAVLEDLSIEYVGTRLDGEAEFVRLDELGGEFDVLLWTVGSGDNHWMVMVHNYDDLPDDLWLNETEFTLPQGEITTGGWGDFTVRGPNSDESFGIWLGAPEEIFRTYSLTDIYVEMYSELASMILEELGWVS